MIVARARLLAVRGLAVGATLALGGCSFIDLSGLDVGAEKSAETQSPDSAAEAGSLGDDASASSDVAGDPAIDDVEPDVPSHPPLDAEAAEERSSSEAASSDAPEDATHAPDGPDGTVDSVADAGTDAGPPPVLHALSQAGWVASADINGVTTWPTTNSPSEAVDGDPTTRWTSAQVQVTGQWFQVDLTKAQTFSEVVLDSGAESVDDYPRAFEIDLSSDANTWMRVASGNGTGQVVTADFAQKTARYVRVLISQDSTAVYWWSIAELDVYAEQ